MCAFDPKRTSQPAAEMLTPSSSRVGVREGHRRAPGNRTKNEGRGAAVTKLLDLIRVLEERRASRVSAEYAGLLVQGCACSSADRS